MQLDSTLSELNACQGGWLASHPRHVRGTSLPSRATLKRRPMCVLIACGVLHRSALAGGGALEPMGLSELVECAVVHGLA